MSEIILKGINKYYGKNHVLTDVDLTINDGDFLTLLGPSGCGKTTMLRIIAGLEKPQAGTMLIDGKEVINAKNSFFLAPSKRELNLVFQSYALWPHMTVYQNVAFVLSAKNYTKDEIRPKVMNALNKMQIGEFEKRYPSELSGGQQQRVAIARAIVSSPKLLLLDEPLSNLDAKLRIEMRGELKRLHKDLGTTVIYVTHDQIEALTMSTRIAVFNLGILEQVDKPINVYLNPANLIVADFIGNPKINFIVGDYKISKSKLEIDSKLGHFIYEMKEQADKTGVCYLGIRPEQIKIKEDGLYEGVVDSCQPAGSETLIQVKVCEENFLIKDIGLRTFNVGDKIRFDISPDNINVFDKKSGSLIKESVI